jgi:hypothetical protein
MNAPSDPHFDAQDVYREDVYTDRRVGTLRVLTPVSADGAADPSRPTIYVGQISVSTPMGTLPISFEVDGATTLSAAIAGFGAGAQKAMDDTMRELQQMRREASSQIVIPEAGGSLGGGGGGRIRVP